MTTEKEWWIRVKAMDRAGALEKISEVLERARRDLEEPYMIAAPTDGTADSPKGIEGVLWCPKATPDSPYPMITENAILGLTDLIGRFSECKGACLGTGLSIEGLDMGRIESEYDVTIGVNEVPKFFHPDFLMLCDTRAIGKVRDWIDPKKTTVVCSRRAMHTIAQNPEHREVFLRLERIHYCHFAQTVPEGVLPEEVLFYSAGIASAAFALACVFGLSRCDLFGFDFYRMHGRSYAYDLNVTPPPGELHTIKGFQTIFTTPAFETMIRRIESNVSAYEGVDFVNMSRHSQLKCFPIGEGALPPEGTIR